MCAGRTINRGRKNARRCEKVRFGSRRRRGELFSRWSDSRVAVRNGRDCRRAVRKHNRPRVAATTVRGHRLLVKRRESEMRAKRPRRTRLPGESVAVGKVKSRDSSRWAISFLNHSRDEPLDSTADNRLLSRTASTSYSGFQTCSCRSRSLRREDETSFPYRGEKGTRDYYTAVSNICPNLYAHSDDRENISLHNYSLIR